LGVRGLVYPLTPTSKPIFKTSTYLSLNLVNSLIPFSVILFLLAMLDFDIDLGTLILVHEW